MYVLKHKIPRYRRIECLRVSKDFTGVLSPRHAEAHLVADVLSVGRPATLEPKFRTLFSHVRRTR